MRGFLFSVMLLLSVTGLLVACADRNDTRTGGLVVVSSDQDGDWDIYLVDLGANTAKKITDNSATDLNPDLSRDGQRITFSSNFLEGEIREYIDRTSENPKLVAKEVLGNTDIFSIDHAGGDLQRLTSTGSVDEQPSWSPDGSQIAYQSDLSGDVEIHVMDSNGGNIEQLTHSPGEDWSPAWSPDGSQIAFASNRGGNWDVFTMNADGSGVEQVTDSPEMDWLPAWSPDGSRIAFASNRDGNWEIYVTNTDGSGVTNLTNDQANDLEPVWSPDGDRLLFASNRLGEQELFVVDTDGSTVKQLGQLGLPFSWVRP